MAKGPVGRRPDGRRYILVPGSGSGEVGRYILPWAEYPSDETETCTTPRDHHIRGLLVTGVAAPGDPAGREQVRQAMKQVAIRCGRSPTPSFPRPQRPSPPTPRC